jgi:hypothetical protein
LIIGLKRLTFEGKVEKLNMYLVNDTWARRKERSAFEKHTKQGKSVLLTGSQQMINILRDDKHICIFAWL